MTHLRGVGMSHCRFDKETIMRFKLFSSAMLAAAIGFVPAALALDQSPSESAAQKMQLEKTVTVPMSQGRSLKVHVVKMGDAMMAMIPIDELNALLSRAEGHSMNVTGN
jgi:hypothetical protein